MEMMSDLAHKRGRAVVIVTLGERMNVFAYFACASSNCDRDNCRSAALSERVIVLLRSIQQIQLGQREGWAFPSKKSRSGHIGLSGLEHAFRNVARKLGIPDALKLYCARHTFGTVAMAETKNPGLVKEVMGHESLTTTMGYLHPETAQIKVVIDRLNQQKHVM